MSIVPNRRLKFIILQIEVLLHPPYGDRRGFTYRSTLSARAHGLIVSWIAGEYRDGYEHFEINEQ